MRTLRLYIIAIGIWTRASRKSRTRTAVAPLRRPKGLPTHATEATPQRGLCTAGRTHQRYHVGKIYHEGAPRDSPKWPPLAVILCSRVLYWPVAEPLSAMNCPLYFVETPW